MGERQVLVRFCDSCGKVIEGRLTLKTCPCCRKDCCIECWEKKNTPRKPRATKEKPLTMEIKDPENALHIQVGDEPSTVANARIDNLTIHVPVDGEGKYTVSIRGKETMGATLKSTIQQALVEYGDEIPDFMTADERTLLKDILEVR